MQTVIFNAIEKLDFRTKESYKTLRTNLEFSGKDRRVISITSSTPNEGKTSVSFLLRRVERRLSWWMQTCGNPY